MVKFVFEIISLNDSKKDVAYEQGKMEDMENVKSLNKVDPIMILEHLDVYDVVFDLINLNAKSWKERI